MGIFAPSISHEPQATLFFSPSRAVGSVPLMEGPARIQRGDRVSCCSTQRCIEIHNDKLGQRSERDKADSGVTSQAPLKSDIGIQSVACPRSGRWHMPLVLSVLAGVRQEA